MNEEATAVNEEAIAVRLSGIKRIPEIEWQIQAEAKNKGFNASLTLRRETESEFEFLVLHCQCFGRSSEFSFLFASNVLAENGT